MAASVLARMSNICGTKYLRWIGAQQQYRPYLHEHFLFQLKINPPLSTSWRYIFRITVPPPLLTTKKWIPSFFEDKAPRKDEHLSNETFMSVKQGDDVVEA